MPRDGNIFLNNDQINHNKKQPPLATDTSLFKQTHVNIAAYYNRSAGIRWIMKCDSNTFY